MPDALESALIIQLRDTINWESGVTPIDASGTLTPVDPVKAFDLTKYQRRDRELAFRDTINAAAVVAVSVEVSNVWNADTVRPIMQGPQRPTLPYNPQDARNLDSKVFHVKNVSLPFDAVQYTDRDLYGRDLLIYETLEKAAKTFTNPAIEPLVSSGSVTQNVTAWSLASGTQVQADINSALPMSRDLFKLPDENLADRDNQMAGYVAQLVQVLKNPFLYADRLYVRISYVDPREVETYVLVRDYFVLGNSYVAGDRVFYQTTYWQANVPTSDVPGTTAAWTAVGPPDCRVWATEPRLFNRNTIVYHGESSTLQWFYEGSSTIHVPQLYALSVPGIFKGQYIDTITKMPERKDAQFWRQKAARFVYDGLTTTDISVISDTASFRVMNSLVQLGGASMTIPGQATFSFDTGVLAPGAYRVALLVKPDSIVEIAGAQNNQGIGGTLGGATFPSTGTNLSWNVGLPPTQWTFQLDYTNLSGATNGFRVNVDLSGQTILQDTVPLYFNDDNGDPLPNGQITSSAPVALAPNGMPQVVNINWASGNGNFHVRTLRFETDHAPQGRYRMFGTLANAMAAIDVIGGDKQTDVMLFDFTTGTTAPPKFNLTFIQDAQLPVRFLQAHLMSVGTTAPTAAVIGFESFRNDCVERALRSVQDSFQSAVTAFGTGTPTFQRVDGTWDGFVSEDWMSFIEVYEPRLRQLPNIPVDRIVENRQYIVISGTVAYETGIFTPGQTFIGGSGTQYSIISVTAEVDQVGAFKHAFAGDVGKPALVPAGLAFDTTAGTVTANYPGGQANPQLAALQPWMIEAGLYVATSDFWTPSNLSASAFLQATNTPGLLEELCAVTTLKPPGPALPDYIFVPTDATGGFNKEMYQVVIVGGTVFGVEDSVGTFYSSPDATTWALVGTPTSNTYFSVAHGAGLFVIVGFVGGIATSPTGATWTDQVSGVGDNLVFVIFDGTQFVVATDGGNVLTSPDGVTWTIHAVTGVALNSVAFGGGLYVVVGATGHIYSSPDLTTWTLRASGTGHFLESVTYGGGQFVAVGVTGTIVTSPDGITWTVQTSGTTDALVTVGFGAGKFVVGSVQKGLFSSTNGVTWTPVAHESTPFGFGNVTYFTGTTFIVCVNSNL